MYFYDRYINIFIKVKSINLEQNIIAAGVICILCKIFPRGKRDPHPFPKIYCFGKLVRFSSTLEDTGSPNFSKDFQTEISKYCLTYGENNSFQKTDGRKYTHYSFMTHI
jgi:hypothetical protein